MRKEDLERLSSGGVGVERNVNWRSVVVERGVVFLPCTSPAWVGEVRRGVGGVR